MGGRAQAKEKESTGANIEGRGEGEKTPKQPY